MATWDSSALRNPSEKAFTLVGVELRVTGEGSARVGRVRARGDHLCDLRVEKRHEVELGRAGRPQHVVARRDGDGGIDAVLAELLLRARVGARVGARPRVLGCQVLGCSADCRDTALTKRLRRSSEHKVAPPSASRLSGGCLPAPGHALSCLQCRSAGRLGRAGRLQSTWMQRLRLATPH